MRLNFVKAISNIKAKVVSLLKVKLALVSFSIDKKLLAEVKELSKLHKKSYAEFIKCAVKYLFERNYFTAIIANVSSFSGNEIIKTMFYKSIPGGCASYSSIKNDNSEQIAIMLPKLHIKAIPEGIKLSEYINNALKEYINFGIRYENDKEKLAWIFNNYQNLYAKYR